MEFKFNEIIRNPIGYSNLYVKRTTSRYGEVGTFTNNVGFLKVSRSAITGQWVSRNV